MNSTARTALSWVGWALVGLIVVSAVASQLLGQPVLLAYVETGSMAPTMQPGDAFIAIPASVAGPVEPGDVIVFEAEVLEGGGLTTHRVVAEQAGGYVTRGDANVVTDQDSGEPIVRDGQVVAKALTVGDTVVVLPKVGLVALFARSALGGLQGWLAGLLGGPGALGTQGFAMGLLGMGVFAYAVATWAENAGVGRGRDQRSRARPDTVDATWLVLALAAGVVLMAVASMAFPLGAQEFELISAETDAPGPRVVKAGTSEQLNYTVPGGGVLPAVVVLEPASEGLSVSPDRFYLAGNEQVNATVTVTAPEEIGYRPQYLREHRYIALLPPGAIYFLYGIHPWVPTVVISLMLGTGFALLGFAWLGGGQLRIRDRAAEMSWLDRIRF